MPSTIRRYPFTVAISSLIVLSAVVMALGTTGIIGPTGVWRVLAIPAYLIMLSGAILANALSLPNNPGFWILCTVAVLLPFIGVDVVRARRVSATRSLTPAR